MSSQCKYSWPCAFDGSIRNLESRALVLPVWCVEVWDVFSILFSFCKACRVQVFLLVLSYYAYKSLKKLQSQWGDQGASSRPMVALLYSFAFWSCHDWPSIFHKVINENRPCSWNKTGGHMIKIHHNLWIKAANLQHNFKNTKTNH